ncbi:c-type cytochrome [Tranquillimonas alkanivorans]|uniref:Cytochrome c n=1 Tax=Tranquillimonas alkanivorans TaxID=441119 RepID=A0A1I5LDP2_9RHOB|nr:c-type cytochrome [Tranquillimonas alkanivorans]SFO94831.1 cytochrome c [Tranquillimonas alkanivorans]
MTKFWIACATAMAMSAPAYAEQHEMVGDAAAGEELFSQCQTCHVVVDDEGNTLAGRNARTGPNLYGVVGRTAGTVEDFRYSSAMEEAGEEGLVWTAETFVPYVQDPTGFLREYLDDPRARGKMSYRVRSEEDAQNLFAYLASLGPGMEEDAAATN